MIEKYLEKKIINYLGFSPTSSQLSAIERFTQFFQNADNKELFILKGCAGTGKTSLIAAFVKTLQELKHNFVLLAPTGRAAKVFSSYSSHPAYTIHKYIYRQKSANDEMATFNLNYNKQSNTVFFIDEASMISNSYTDSSFGSGCLLDDLMEFVYNGKNNKIIFVGDIAQLPPVGLNISPALNKNELCAAYYLNIREENLNDVVRQAKDSGILYNANLVRAMLEQSEHKLKLVTNIFADTYKINGGELLDELEMCYDKFGETETLVVCRSNSRANKFNEGIRQRILYKEDDFCSGDRIMIVKNNYFWCKDYDKIDFIANGDIALVKRTRKKESLYGFNFIEVELEFADYQEEITALLILDTLRSESPALNQEQGSTLFRAIEADYADIPAKRKRYEKIREDKYYNALQIKFAYAITCHKSQGGQWDAVFVDQGYLPEDSINDEYWRWLYTAITRAKKRLYFLNFNEDMFDNKSSTRF